MALIAQIALGVIIGGLTIALVVIRLTVGLFTSACLPAIAYSRLGTGRTPCQAVATFRLIIWVRSSVRLLSLIEHFHLRHLAEARRSRHDAWVSGQPCQLLFFGQARPSRRLMSCTREAQGRDFLPAKSLTAPQGVQKMMGYP